MSADDNASERDLRSLRALTGPDAPHGQADLLSQVDDLVGIALSVLKVDGVGLMLLDEDDRPRVAAATDEQAQVLEDTQTACGTGPGVDAVRTGQTVAESDLQTSVRYPRLTEPLAGTPLHAVLSSPVRVDRTVVGSLNAFDRREHRWTPEEVRANDAYAQVVGGALRLVVQAALADDSLRRLQDQTELTGGLEDDPEA